MSHTSALFIAGPTAVGKSAVAIALARKLNGEIISVDSMNVYRGLDIGTAKPSKLERAEIAHHLIDVAELTENFDAARFCFLASQAEEQIRARGKQPIFCGGTGLYFKAYLEGLDPLPHRDPAMRSALQNLSLDQLQKKLVEIDPQASEQIDFQNSRRIIRAIEIISSSGKPLKENRVTWKQEAVENLPPIFVLSRPREILVNRINQRTDRMIEGGWVEETRHLLELGLEKNTTASQAIGYREIIHHLRGGCSKKEAIDLIKIRTRQFAKRQMTWFRAQSSARWIEIFENETAEETAERIQII